MKLGTWVKVSLFAGLLLETGITFAKNRQPSVIAGSGSTVAGVFNAGPTGTELALTSAIRLSLEPNAKIQLFAKPQELQLGKGPKTLTYNVRLMAGKADVEIAKSPKSAVMASVGKINALITSGRVRLVLDNEVAIVANAEGEVKSLIGQHWQPLAVGETSRMDAQRPRGEHLAALAKPKIKPGNNLWLAVDSTVNISGILWEALPGAQSYEVRLNDSTSNEALQTLRTHSPQLEAPLRPLRPGVYNLIVRGLDAWGIEGTWSDALPIRVIGVELPSGAYTEGNAVYLGSNQQVQFTHTDGLEMTFSGAGKSLPATQAIGLYQNQTTIIGFHLPGTPDTATARLEPRDILADVYCGPKTATWPGDTLQLSIHLKTRSGRPVPDWVQANPSVSLGLEPISVKWTTTGPWLKATIAPAASRGPWIVRVEVKDQHGVLLGRDFVEIIEAPKPPRADGIRVSQAEAKPN